MNIILQLSILIALQVVAFAACSSLPSDLQENLQGYLEKGLEKKKFAGLSVIVVSKSGDVVKMHLGHRDIENSLPPDDETLYEIGSITKPFARLALATQNKIQLDDPISNFLPPGIRVPKPQGKDIKIEHLLTHTGIKFSVPCTVKTSAPDDLICFGVAIDQDLTDPYAGTTREKVYDFVSEFSLTVDGFPQAFPEPGSFYSYSNVGIGLLGEFLGQEHQTSFENFLSQSVLQPLGMHHSKINMPCEKEKNCSNLAKVYGKYQVENTWEERSLWHLPGMSAAGGLRSNLNDMEIFLKANLSPEETPLQNAVERLQKQMKELTLAHNKNLCEEGEIPEEANCNPQPRTYYYGWEAVSPGKVFFHGGATGASQSMMMFSMDHSEGVVILSNSKVGKGKQTLYHYPNDVALCIYQLLGKPLTSVDFCKRISE